MTHDPAAWIKDCPLSPQPHSAWLYQVGGGADPDKWHAINHRDNATPADVAKCVAAWSTRHSRIDVRVARRVKGNLHENGAPKCTHLFTLDVG